MAYLGDELRDSQPGDGVSSLRFAFHADLLLASSWDCHVRLYDARLGTCRVAFKQRVPVLDAAFVDTEAAVSGGLSGSVRLHHFQSTLEEVREAEREQRAHHSRLSPGQVVGKHEQPVKCVEHNTANGLVLSGSWDASLRLWDIRAPEGPGRAVGTLPLPGKVYSMATSDTRLVVATAGRRIQVYDLRSLRAAAPPLQQRESPLKFQARRQHAITGQVGADACADPMPAMLA